MRRKWTAIIFASLILFLIGIRQFQSASIPLSESTLVTAGKSRQWDHCLLLASDEPGKSWFDFPLPDVGPLPPLQTAGSCADLPVPQNVSDGELKCCVTGLVTFPGTKKGSRTECHVGYANEPSVGISFDQVVGHQCGDESIPLPDPHGACTFSFRGSVRNSTPRPGYHCRKEGVSQNAAGGKSAREEIINRESLYGIV